jgi:hypothetical protein
MKPIESVKILKTLKSRSKKTGESKYWLEGEVLHAPLPPEIIAEVRLNRGTVRVLNWGVEPDPVPLPVFDFRSEPEFKTPDITTGTTIAQRKAIEAEEAKTRPKLVKRRRKKK